MQKKMNLKRPRPMMLAANFIKGTNQRPPEENKTYYNDTESPIRSIAEYEEMGGVVLAYIGTDDPTEDKIQHPPTGERTFGVPNDLIIKMQQLDTPEPVHVFILCNDVKEKENIVVSLQKTAQEENLLFDKQLIHIIPWNTDTYWTRDFSPWWVKYKDTEIYGISKHIYTSLGGGSVGIVEGSEGMDSTEAGGIFRCNDDYGAVKIADYLNSPICKWNRAKWSNGQTLPPIPENRWFFSGLLNVGGNYMVTSNGIIASSYLVAAQNELPSDIEVRTCTLSDHTLDNRMTYIMEQTNRFLGANKYLVFIDPTGTYIGHIDCWAKFLSDNKVLVAKSEDQVVNKGLDDIANYFSQSGFTVYRVLCQNIYIPNEEFEPATTAPYTNSLILNKTVYVPIAGGPYKEHDNNALQVYQEALGSDYKVVGVLGKKETPWLGTDALHCRTNTIPREVVRRWLKSQ